MEAPPGPPPFTGAYVYGEGTFPLVDFGCVFNVSAGAGVGIFYFLEGPTYGGRMNAHVAGEALCILSVRGDLDLVGLKRGSDYSFSGRGGVKGMGGGGGKQGYGESGGAQDGFDFHLNSPRVG